MVIVALRSECWCLADCIMLHVLCGHLWNSWFGTFQFVIVGVPLYRTMLTLAGNVIALI